MPRKFEKVRSIYYSDAFYRFHLIQNRKPPKKPWIRGQPEVSRFAGTIFAGPPF